MSQLKKISFVEAGDYKIGTDLFKDEEHKERFETLVNKRNQAKIDYAEVAMFFTGSFVFDGYRALLAIYDFENGRIAQDVNLDNLEEKIEYHCQYENTKRFLRLAVHFLDDKLVKKVDIVGLSADLDVKNFRVAKNSLDLYFELYKKSSKS